MSNTDNSEGGKPWYASKTVWGGLLAVVGPVAAVIFKHQLPAEFLDAIAASLASIGGAVAIWGRFTATTSIR